MVGEDERELVLKGGEKKTILTHLVLVVSNFHFNKKAQSLRQEVTCSPLDCYVSLKYSSTKFKPDGGVAAAESPTEPELQDVSDESASQYYFDSHYLFLDYQAFTALVADGYLAEHFWPRVKANFERTTGLPLEIADFLQATLGDDADDDDDDDDEGQRPKSTPPPPPPPPPKKKRGPTKVLESSDEEETNSGDDYHPGEEEEEENEEGARKKKRPQSLAAAAAATSSKNKAKKKKTAAASKK